MYRNSVSVLLVEDNPEVMADKIKILVLEDSPVDAELMHRLLSDEKLDFEFNLAEDKNAFLQALDNFGPSVILADNSLPQFTAKEALEIVHQRLPNTPFILVTGSVSEEFAADIIKLGADDYILKDRMIRLPAAIDTAIKQQKAEKEKKEAQESFRKSNERFQTLSRATKDAIWDWNLLTGEVWWNESFYHLLGYDPNLPVPDQYEWTKRVHYKDRNKIMARLKGVASNGIGSWEDEFRLKLKDGTYATVLDRAYVLKNDSGEPVRVIGALVDITEQKKLISEMEVLSLIARKTSNGVLVFNRHSGYTSWINQAFTRFTGYMQQDLDKKDLWEMLKGPDTDEGTLLYIADQIKNNHSFSCDVLIYSKHGEQRWQSMSGEPMQEYDANAPNYFVMATDISDRKKVEEERLADKIEQQKEVSRIILRTQEMQRNELGRELHDNINQILAAVNLKLGYYLEEPEGNLEIVENCRRDLYKAIEETRNLAHHMVMPMFSKKNLKQELELLIGTYHYGQEIMLRFNIAHEEEISSDIKETLFRIAQEHLSNIAKYARAGKIEMHLDIISQKISMTIHDNGVGFDTQQKRTGIGITNILNRVESYNGHVDILSQPGKGCTLSLSIPLVR